MSQCVHLLSFLVSSEGFISHYTNIAILQPESCWVGFAARKRIKLEQLEKNKTISVLTLRIDTIVSEFMSITDVILLFIN